MSGCTAPSSPVVSIVMPVLNGAKTLSGTLDSIRRQEFKDWECIVVDDGSTDDSFALAQKCAEMDKRFYVIQRPIKATRGASACRNIGLTASRGTYVQFFDSDDLMHPNHLQLKVKAAQEGGADAVVCRLREVFPDGTERLNVIAAHSVPEALLDGAVNWYVSGPMWRRDRIQSARFPESISNLDDLVFNLRAFTLSRRIVYIPDALIDYIRHGQGITGEYSRASMREISSTIQARNLIQRELRAAGLYSSYASACQLRGIVHLGYLSAVSKSPRALMSYINVLVGSTKLKTIVYMLQIMACLVIWAATGRGYGLVRKLRT